jgi:hypothetical protein
MKEVVVNNTIKTSSLTAFGTSAEDASSSPERLRRRDTTMKAILNFTLLSAVSKYYTLK